MKKNTLFAIVAMLIMSVSALAQSNSYNMVIEMANGTKINIGPNDVKNIYFNDGQLVVSGVNLEQLVQTTNENMQRTTKDMDYLRDYMNARLELIEAKIADVSSQSGGASSDDIKRLQSQIDKTALKADLVAMSTKLATLESTLNTKEAALKAEIAKKANQTDLDALATVVNGKADQTALDAEIAARVKAVEGLTAQIVGNNAKIKTIEEVLATKADKVEFVNAVVLLTGKINDKADLAKANANATEIAAVKAVSEKAAKDAAEALKDVAKAQSTADAAQAAADKAQSTADAALAAANKAQSTADEALAK